MLRQTASRYDGASPLWRPVHLPFGALTRHSVLDSDAQSNAEPDAKLNAYPDAPPDAYPCVHPDALHDALPFPHPDAHLNAHSNAHSDAHPDDAESDAHDEEGYNHNNNNDNSNHSNNNKNNNNDKLPRRSGAVTWALRRALEAVPRESQDGRRLERTRGQVQQGEPTLGRDIAVRNFLYSRGRKSEGDSNGALQEFTQRYASSRLHSRTLNDEELPGTVLMKSDGTAVAFSDNSMGECDVRTLLASLAPCCLHSVHDASATPNRGRRSCGDTQLRRRPPARPAVARRTRKNFRLGPSWGPFGQSRAPFEPFRGPLVLSWGTLHYEVHAVFDGDCGVGSTTWRAVCLFFSSAG